MGSELTRAIIPHLGRAVLERRRGVYKLKLIRIRASTGVILPEELLARLKGDDGDVLCAVETSSGVVLMPCDPEIVEQLGEGRRFMRRYRDTFRALAK
jgi:hypothetical protein